MTIPRQSPCKVNLLLNILGRRPDGFHELETILHPVPVCDTLDFHRLPQGVAMTCSDPALAADPSNLVWRAAEAFLREADVGGGVRIHLEKKIPLAAGLGGGSGNAGTTLLALNELFGKPLASDALYRLAATLGSDVPFFLQPNPALGTGRGEQIQPLAPFPALRGAWVVLIHPGFGVATAWAYQNLARYPGALAGERGRAQRMIQSLQGNDLTAVAACYNSLEAPVLPKYPLLALFQEFLRAEGAATAMMSGSGSSTFAIAASRADAERLLDRFKTKFGSAYWTAIASLDPSADASVL